MRLSVIFFEGSWVTLSSWVWFWHDFPEGVRSLENQNLQFILANAFSSSELKKVYGIDGVPRNLVGVLLEQRGTKLCQRFSFLFLLLCFCFFVFVLFSVFDHLFIKCKYFSIGSGGAQVYFKKNWFDFKEMLTTLRRLDFCDWNCAVTFHERSCLIPYPIDGKVSLRVLLAVDSRLFEGELVKKWSKSRTGAPHPLPQSLCIWYTGLQRLLLFFGLFLSIFFCCCFLVCAQGC